MPLPPVRFTVRQMMIAVAIVALGIGAWTPYRLGERARPNYKDAAWFY